MRFGSRADLEDLATEVRLAGEKQHPPGGEGSRRRLGLSDLCPVTEAWGEASCSALLYFIYLYIKC